MRVLITSDWHIRNSSPRSRKDNYVEEQWRKVDFILDTAEQNKCEYILHCGDLTEFSPYPRFDWQCFTNLVTRLTNLPETITVVAIAGQHDLYFRGNREKTPLYALANANVPFVVIEQGSIMYPHPTEPYVHYLYGASYGVDHDDICPSISPVCIKKILMLHELVSMVDNWNGHVPFLTPQELLNTFPQFDVIATGDNHKGFIFEKDGRYVVNCGSLMRTNIDQADHKPFVAIYDTQTNKMKHIFIPIAPFDEVMKVEEKQRDDGMKEEMEAFINGVSRGGVVIGDFMHQLRAKMKHSPPEIIEVLDEAIARIERT